MIIRTEYANFGNYKDLLRFMQEENIREVTIRTEYWGAKLIPLKMTQDDVADVIRMSEESV